MPGNITPLLPYPSAHKPVWSEGNGVHFRCDSYSVSLLTDFNYLKLNANPQRSPADIGGLQKSADEFVVNHFSSQHRFAAPLGQVQHLVVLWCPCQNFFRDWHVLFCPQNRRLSVLALPAAAAATISDSAWGDGLELLLSRSRSEGEPSSAGGSAPLDGFPRAPGSQGCEATTGHSTSLPWLCLCHHLPSLGRLCRKDNMQMLLQAVQISEMSERPWLASCKNCTGSNAARDGR